MPLPPALLARLKKRGIVKEKEEVIAENYEKDEEKKYEDLSFAGAPGCPNKYNPYHYCTEFCHDFWREGTPENRLSELYNRRRLRMLKKYSLPEGWTEVYDAGMARHYYWCPETDEVSWLSPRHPHAVIGEAAPKLAREIFKEKLDRENERVGGEDSVRGGFSVRFNAEEATGGGGRDRKKNEDRRRRHEDSDSDSEKRPEMSERERLKRARRKGIDPMDPAAYSDVTEGKWSSGLAADAHSGVDTTAGGPLFQMRPYPAPGAILRARGKDKEKE